MNSPLFTYKYCFAILTVWSWYKCRLSFCGALLWILFCLGGIPGQLPDLQVKSGWKQKPAWPLGSFPLWSFSQFWNWHHTSHTVWPGIGLWKKPRVSFKPDVALLFVTRKARWGRGVKSLDIVLWLWLFDKLKRCWLQLPASSSTSSPCGRPSTTWPPPSPSWPSCSCSWSGLECSRSGLSRPQLRSSLGFNIQLLWRILQWLSSLLLDSFGRNKNNFLQHIELWLMYVDLFYLVAIWFAWQNNCQISFCLITVLFCFNF